MGRHDPEVVTAARRHDRLRDVNRWLDEYMTTPDPKHAADLLKAAEHAMARHLACEACDADLLAAVVVAHVDDLADDVLRALQKAIGKRSGVRCG